MASPFSIFRKYQKQSLVVLTGLSMIAFVFLPMVMQSMGTGKTQNPVVVKSKFGDLRESDLQRLRVEQQQLANVLQGVEMKLLVMGDQEAAMGVRDAMASLGDPSEKTLVQTWLLTKHAESLGCVVDNKLVNSFLEALTQKKFSNQDWNEIFQSKQIDAVRFFELVRSLLLASQTRLMFSVSTTGVTPGERWDYFLRLNQLAKIEAVPYAVDGFAADVPDPDEATLLAFYNEHKYDLALPLEPEVGFREPTRVDLRYFDVDMAKYANEFVTDAEIQAEYEANRAAYDRSSQAAAALGGSGETPAPSGESTTAPKDEGAGAAPSATPAPEVQATPSSKPTGETPSSSAPAGEPAAATTTPAPQSESAPATQAPSAETTAPATPAPDAPAAGDSSAHEHRQPPFRWAAYRMEGETAATSEGAGSVATADDSSTAEGAATAAPSANAATSAAAVGVTPPADDAASKAAPGGEASKEAAGDAALPRLPGGDALTNPAASGAAPQTGLTPALRDNIRNQLAMRKLGAAFQQLAEKAQDYSAKKNIYELSKNPAALSPPVEPDWETLARDMHLGTGVTGLVGRWQVQQTPVLRAISPTSSQPLGTIFFNQQPDFQPVEGLDFGTGRRYFTWKTREESEHTLKFAAAGVREIVLKNWKLVKAREIAQQKVDQIAAAAAQSGKLLKDYFAEQPDRQVLTPEPFTWMTPSDLPNFMGPVSTELSSIEGIPMAGNKFMRKVFQLEPGSVGTSFNQPETVIYVIRLDSLSPDQQQLWDRFLREPMTSYATASIDDRRELIRDWFKSLEASANLEWMRHADPPRDAVEHEAPADGETDSDAS